MDWPHDPSLYPPYLQAAIRKGIGLGEGAAYVPWVKVPDFGSRGTCSNFEGIRIDRPYHFLSSKEATYFLLEERNPENSDIQEQYPILDIQSTMRLCAQLGVSHPYNGRAPRPFTIDFVISRRNGRKTTPLARSIKTPSDLADPETVQRLKVEHQWCSQVGIDWASVDTQHFTRELLSSLRFIRQWFVDRYTPREESAKRFAEAFQCGFEMATPLEELIQKAARRSRQRDGVSLFRYCAWSNLVKLDLRRPVSLDHSVILLP
ncbi:TnsA endonuclease N-terminal domain-containing protein [Variovorax sp. J31P179]|uniref:TnsA endonuclease N-terminal domain-containing protein n=1 Tax=Variovorax sp. J31P179 TaxID=3053508 RepID=UPI0025753008|nr:TnsA endonuclease N-terminal domain-containing protein [Variovorax sp. J31P179]MDM0081691.1 TnsA endonuclease N-terminal domain-containing protein [Variovorax sp. J31P179]